MEDGLIQMMASSYDTEIEAIQNNPKYQDELYKLYERSQLSDEEKREFEIQILGREDSFKYYFSENGLNSDSLEQDVKTLYEKYLRAEGRVNHLQSQLRSVKGENKDLRNMVNGLNSENRKLKDEGNASSTRYFDGYGDSFGYIPPQNIDMEEAILATYLKHPSWMDNFNQKYLNLMFYKEAHKVVHSGMINTQNRLTQTNIAAYLRKIEQLEVAGGPYFIEQLSNHESTEDPLILQNYIEQIEQFFLARQVIMFSTNIQREAFCGEKEVGLKWTYETTSRGLRHKPEKKTEKIDDFVEYIRDLSFRSLELLPFRFRKNYNIEIGTQEVIENTEELIKREGRPIISTGYHEFDRVTHGVTHNKLYLIGARPKNGKTTFLVNITDNVLLQGKTAAFFNYEISYNELLQKFLAKRADVDLEKFEFYDSSNPFTDEEMERIKIVAEQLKKLPLQIRGGKPQSIDHVIAECKQIKAMHPDMALAVFDGLQAFECLVPERGNKSDFFYHVLNTLKKDVAEELGITVLITAQLKAQVEKYKNKKPRSIDDFSDCKGIPEVTDGAFLLYRPEHYFEDNEDFKGWINVHPIELRNSGRKNRQFKLGIDLKYAKMTDWDKNNTQNILNQITL